MTEAQREASGELPMISYEPLDEAVPGSERNFRVRYPKREESA